jgi:hypothetical protein
MSLINVSLLEHYGIEEHDLLFFGELKVLRDRKSSND